MSINDDASRFFNLMWFSQPNDHRREKGDDRRRGRVTKGLTVGQASFASALFSRVFDESKITRHGKGDDRGGEFAPKAGGGGSVPEAKSPPKQVSPTKPSPAQKAREQKGSEPIGKKKSPPANATQNKPDVVMQKFEHTVEPKSIDKVSLNDETKFSIKKTSANYTPEQMSKMAKQYEDLGNDIWDSIPIGRNETTDKNKLSRLDDSEKVRMKKGIEFDNKAALYANFAENSESIKEPFDYTPPENQSFDDMVEFNTSNADVAGGGPGSWSDIDNDTQERVQEEWTDNRMREHDFLQWVGESVREGIDMEEVIRANIDDLLDNADWDNLDVGQGDLLDQIESTVKEAIESGLKIGKEMNETDSQKLKQLLKEASPDWKSGELNDGQVESIIKATNQALMASDDGEANFTTESELAEIITIDEDDAVQQFIEAHRRGKSWASGIDSLIESEAESQMENDDILRGYAENEWESMDSDDAFSAAQDLGHAEDNGGGSGGSSTNSTLSGYGIEDAASFVGAPDGTEVSILGDQIMVQGPGGFEMNRTINRGYIKADLFEIGEDYKGQATDIISQMVKQARAAGFDEIRTYAAGQLGGSYNGYYTWPCMGYDQSIKGLSGERQIRTLFPGVESIQDLYDTPGGRDWWFVNGSGLRDAKFDLTDGSRSMKVMERYLNEKRRK